MYVGITGSLLNEVKNLINWMEQKEMSAVPDTSEIKIDGEQSWVQEIFWGKYIGLREQIPEEWKSPMKSFRVDEIAYKGKRFSNVVFILTKAVLGPPVKQDGYYSRDFVPVNTLPPAGLVDPAVVEVLEGILARHEVNVRWSRVRDEILGFLQKCKSLNEALKLWPQIEMYIPKSRLDAVAEKRNIEKKESQAVEALKKMDTANLTAAAVIARMSDKS